MVDYLETFYAATRSDDHRYAPLDRDTETETCVVGGGLAGIAVVLALAERGRPAMLLESRRIGWGASGRNGGFVSRGFPVPMPTLAMRLGDDAARNLWRLSGDALETVRKRAEAIGNGTITSTGALRCRIAGHPDTLRTYVAEMNHRFGAGLEYLPQSQLSAALASERYVDGYANPSSFMVHPLNLVRGMAAMAARRGALLHEASIVRRIDRSGARWKIETANGNVTARSVVLAGGAYLGGLHRRLSLATVPVATFVMATSPAPLEIRAAIRTTAGISDTRVATDYYRVLPDGRLLWGGRASAWRPGPARLARLLHGDMKRFYPQLATIKVESAWAGLMPIARHRMPVICPLESGLWAASCFGGLGLANTTLAGELIAAAIAEGDDRYRYFAPFGLPFAGGSMGRAAFQMIYWRHQIGDQLCRSRPAARVAAES